MPTEKDKDACAGFREANIALTSSALQRYHKPVSGQGVQITSTAHLEMPLLLQLLALGARQSQPRCSTPLKLPRLGNTAAFLHQRMGSCLKLGLVFKPAFAVAAAFLLPPVSQVKWGEQVNFCGCR